MMSAFIPLGTFPDLDTLTDFDDIPKSQSSEHPNSEVISSPYTRDSDERFKIKTMQRLLKIRAKTTRIFFTL